mmetsp:Transcript_31838/g.40835  ORF Transcript_31838/g.40835 Transcript_31838/m.40835 type:complete len:119 (+) Transcript_31838:415-771(+)
MRGKGGIMLLVQDQFQKSPHLDLVNSPQILYMNTAQVHFLILYINRNQNLLVLTGICKTVQIGIYQDKSIVIAVVGNKRSDYLHGKPRNYGIFLSIAVAAYFFRLNRGACDKPKRSMI